MLLQRIVLAGFFAMAVLFFLPWTRVLIPANLTPDQPAVVLKNLALILDCSTSMKEGIVSGDVKIQTALKSAGELIDKLPADLRLTVVLTGHDRETPRKAQIIRKLAPLTTGREELKKKLTEIDAVGESSIAEALKDAGEELLADKGNGGIVVITDGPDVSGGDASGQAATIAKRPNLTYGVNLIGFGTPPRDLRPLRIIAVAGKGKFQDTQSASELAEALDGVAADARKSIQQDFLVNDLGGRSQTGMRIALGSGTVALSLLTLLYFALILFGLAAAGLLLLGTQLRVRIKLLDRLRPFLALGLGAVSLLAGVLLVALLVFGFPVENQFRQFVFTSRTGWLTLIVFLNLTTMIATLLLWRQERSPERPCLRIEVIA